MLEKIPGIDIFPLCDLLGVTSNRNRESLLTVLRDLPQDHIIVIDTNMERKLGMKHLSGTDVPACVKNLLKSLAASLPRVIKQNKFYPTTDAMILVKALLHAKQGQRLSWKDLGVMGLPLGVYEKKRAELEESVLAVEVAPVQ